MADRSGKARAEAAELLDALRAESIELRGELAAASNTLAWLRTRIREERAAREAISNEIVEAGRVNLFIDAADTRAWPRWEFARRQLETYLDQIAAGSTPA